MLESVIAFVTSGKLLELAAAAAALAHTIDRVWAAYERREGAKATRRESLTVLARAVYAAAESWASATPGATGPQKWAKARDLIPKAAKAAGLDIRPADVDTIHDLVEVFAHQNKRPKAAAHAKP